MPRTSAPPRLVRALFCGCALFAFTACEKKPPAPAAAAPRPSAPYGGTVVALGAGTYHLEFVRDPILGTLRAYVWDRDLRSPVTLATRGLDLTITAPGTLHGLTLNPLPATGDAPGTASRFEAQSDWLQTTSHFEVTLDKLEIRGTPFTALTFPFPLGRRP